LKYFERVQKNLSIKMDTGNTGIQIQGILGNRYREYRDTDTGNTGIQIQGIQGYRYREYRE